jgi:hypothetical protein
MGPQIWLWGFLDGSEDRSSGPDDHRAQDLERGRTPRRIGRVWADGPALYHN